MMMRVLQAGGLPLLTDGERQADDDNPRGYFEYERVKKLDKGDTAWLSQAEGKGVKVISALLKHLPANYRYRVLFMERNLAEVMASQRKMLIRRGKEPDEIPDEEMADLLAQHVAQVKAWLARQPHFQLLEVSYNAMLADPRPWVQEVNRFLGGFLDEKAMVAAVDPSLYRNRKP